MIGVAWVGTDDVGRTELEGEKMALGYCQGRAQKDAEDAIFRKGEEGRWLVVVVCWWFKDVKC